MKKVVLVITVIIICFTFVTNSSATSPCRCKCKKKQPDLGDTISIGVVISLGVGIPVLYSNYLIHSDNNHTLMYITDGLIPVYLLGGLLANQTESETFKTIVGIIGVADYAFFCIYPIVSLIQAYANEDSDAVGRGWTGIALYPISFLIAGLSIPCMCAPEDECAHLYPEIDSTYAGFRYTVRF